uniref:Zinc finger CCCH domain-containing protein 6 n=1 Tax=Steinernema glaseri TaxID=37863 RepID=A0A1I7Z1A6_9BILA
MLPNFADPGAKEVPARELEDGEIQSDEDDGACEGVKARVDCAKFESPKFRAHTPKNSVERGSPKSAEPHMWDFEQRAVIEDFSHDIDAYPQKKFAYSEERKSRKRSAPYSEMGRSTHNPTHNDFRLTRSAESALSPPKTKQRCYPVCKYFREGFCRSGESCAYSHDVRNSPCNPVLCTFYKHGFCRRALTCKFLHGEYPCKAFHKGECSKDRCPYSHLPLNEYTAKLLDKLLILEVRGGSSPLAQRSLCTRVRLAQQPRTPKESPVKSEEKEEEPSKLAGSLSSTDNNEVEATPENKPLEEVAAPQVDIPPIEESSPATFNINDMLADFLNPTCDVVETEAEQEVRKDQDTAMLETGNLQPPTLESPIEHMKPKCSESVVEEREGCLEHPANPELAAEKPSTLLDAYAFVEKSKSTAAMEADAFEANLRRAAEVVHHPHQPPAVHRQPPSFTPFGHYHAQPSNNGPFFEREAPMMRYMGYHPFPVINRERGVQDIDERPCFRPQMFIHNQAPMFHNGPRCYAPPKRRTLLRNPMEPVPMAMPPSYHEYPQQQQDTFPPRYGSRNTVLRRAPCLPDQFRRESGY